MKNKLKPGDIVEVLSPSEILKTLDSDGTLHNLPFMPEMIVHCGNKFRVRSRIEKTCVASHAIREFINDDIVFLENLRCDGSSHDGCQRGCMIFWDEAWLRKTNDNYENKNINLDKIDELKIRLKTKENSKRYFCQSTQLNISTRKISPKERFFKLIKEVQTKTISITKALKSLIFPVWRKLSYKLLSGDLKKTPVQVLNLQPGEIVEVKSFKEILSTLNKDGSNRGLEFHLDMKQFCGKRFRVRNRLEKMISEVTGEMVEVNNTVILENVTCCYEYRFLGCAREIYQYWREIWLKRIET